MMDFKTIYNTVSNSFDRLDKRYPDQIPYIYAIAGCFFLAMGSLVVKQCKDIPAFEMVYFRSIFLIFISTRLMSVSEERPYIEDKKAFKFMVMRALFSSTSTLCFFTANQLINLGESTILFLTSPIWSNFVGFFFFKERFNPINLFYTLLSFGAIVVLLKPPFIFGGDQTESTYDTNQMLGQILSIVGAIAYAINSNINKQIKGKVSKQQLVFYLCSGALGVSSLLKINKSFATMDVYTWFNIGCITAFSLLQFLVQIFLNQALFMKGANKILPFNYFQVLFALLFDFFLYDKTIDFIQTLSSILIIFCCYKIAINK